MPVRDERRTHEEGPGPYAGMIQIRYQGVFSVPPFLAGHP